MMVEEFTGGVALTKDVIATHRSVFPSFFEDIALRGVQIFVHETGSAGSNVDLYVVPSRKTLYINSLALSFSGTNVSNVAGVYIISLKLGVKLISLPISASIHNLEHDHIVFPIPVRIDEGDTLRAILLGSSGNISAKMHGFIVDKTII